MDIDIFLRIGNTGLGFRAQSSAATTSKTYDPSATAGRHAHPGAVALLRRRRALHEHRHVEDTPSATPQPTSQVIVRPWSTLLAFPRSNSNTFPRT